MRIRTTTIGLLLGLIWVTAAHAQTTYDDTDSSIIYSRTEVSGDGWTGVTNESPAPDYGASQHYSNGCAMPVQSATSVQGAMAAINFIGTSITVIGEKGINFGIGAFAIDGGALSMVDTYSATKLNQQALFTASGLANEPHVLTYQVTCNKNAASSGYYQVLDAYTVTGTNNPFSNAAQNSKGANNITLGGSGWTCGGDAADISNSQCWDGTAGDSITYTFTGSLAEVFIRPDVGDGYFDVQIDGTTVAHDVSGQYTTTDNDQLDAWMAFAKSGLSSGTHTMKLVVDGNAPYPSEAENSGQKNLLQFDVGLAFPSSTPTPVPPTPTPTPTSQPTSSASGPNGVAPPAGFQWVQTYSENFTTESDINHNVWSAAQNYTMAGANGVAVQGSPTNPTSPGSTGYLVNTNNSINQRYGFWQWVAKYPHNDSGEGAGYHSDLYLGPSTTVPYMEDDICEWDTVFTGATSCKNFVSEVAGTDEYGAAVPNGGSGSPPIGDAFHTWGVYWHNDGTPQGTVQDWFDGVAQPGTYTLTNANWALGMRPLIINDSCGTGNCSSASNNPLYIQSFQVWQLAAVSGTPVPSSTPTPTGQATVCNPVITSPANNSILTQGNITVGATANCNGTYDHIRWSWGLVSPAGETDFALIPSGSSTAVMNASTQAPGTYQAAAAVYLANGSIVTSNGNGGWSPLFHYTLSAAPTPTPVPPTPTPVATGTPSPNCTEITTSGPTINVNGNLWSFSPTFQALENGAVFGGSGANLADMTLSGGAIYVFYPPTSTWYVSSPAGTGWNNGQATGPPCPGVTPSPTPSPPTPTPTIVPTSTPSPSATPSPTPVPTNTATVTPTGSATPSATPSANPSASITPSCPPGYTLECPNCVLTPPMPTPVASPTPAPLVMRANDFLNIWGYTTHHGQDKITTAQIEQGLTYTGVRHYRDDGTINPSLLSDYCAIHAATGATMIMLPFGGDLTDTMGFLDTLAKCNALMAVEGQNEANNQPFQYGSTTCDPDGHLGGNTSYGCGAFQRDFYAAEKADSNLSALPMLAPTEMGDQNPDNAGLQFLSIQPGSTAEFPVGTVYADVANIHPYDNCATNPPRDNDAWSMAAPVASDQGCYDGMNGEFEYQTWRNHFPAYPGVAIPYLATESGQATAPENTSGISYDIQGKVYTDLALDAALRGAQHWFVYQMGEEGDGLGAVYTASFTYKLGATYMHNLTTILADTSSAFTPTVVQFTITPQPATVHALLVQKSNGKHELIIDGEAFASETQTPVAVSIPSASGGSVYDITVGTMAVSTFSGPTVTLTMSDHIMIVEF